MATDDFVFARLPPELCIDVFTSVSWEAAIGDKDWLCAFATTSRLVWGIVRPILYHTVVLTIHNIDKWQAVAQNGHFALTRRLVSHVGVPHLGYEGVDINNIVHHYRGCGRAFSSVGRFSGSVGEHTFLCQDSDGAFAPPHVTLVMSGFMRLVGMVQQADWDRSAALCGVTHLHVVVNPHLTVYVMDIIWPAWTALSHIILESSADDWDERVVADTVLPFVLGCPSLQRVLIRASRDSSGTERTWRVLEDFVRIRDERRVWVLDEPTDHLLSLLTVDGALSSDKWTAGRPLIPHAA